MFRMLHAVLCIALPSIAAVAADPARLAEDFDAHFEPAMAAHEVPGATLVVVQDGRVVLLRGYGLANLEAQTAVDPEQTLFRIGSVSKLLIATAVAQCVNRGLLDLDADINSYLTEFQVPDTFPEPITMRHLLTHTAGFDDRFFGIGKRTPEELEPLGTFLAKNLPPRIEPPGVAFNYSNFGGTLAAHVVETVSDMDFAAFVRSNVFHPMGIAGWGYDQPLPNDALQRMATTYWHERGRLAEFRWRDTPSQVWPGGYYAATAVEMAQFLLGHLRGGEVEGKIIQANLAHELTHERHFVQHPALLHGQALGFHERFHNGHRILWHGGLAGGFTAFLVMAPEARVGFFMACNSEAGGRLERGAFEVFAKHFLAVPDETFTPPAVEGTPYRNLVPYTGSYAPSRRVRQGIEALAFADRQTRFEEYHGQYLDQFTLRGVHLNRWRPIGRDVFEAVDSAQPRRLVFLRNDEGAIARAAFDSASFSIMTSLERLRWWQTAAAQIGFLASYLLVLASVIIRAVWARRIAPLDSSAAFRMMTWAAACYLLFLLLFAGYLTTFAPYDIVFGMPFSLKVLLVLPMLGVLFTLAATLAKIARWRTNGPNVQLHDLLSLTACWGMFVLLDAWNLLGWAG